MRDLLRCGLFAILLLSISGHGQSSDNGVKLSNTAESAKAGPTTSSSKAANSAIAPTFGNGTCPSRTANYITHTLPQQCLRTDRVSSATNATAAGDDTIEPARKSSGLNDAPSASEATTEATAGTSASSSTYVPAAETRESTSSSLTSATGTTPEKEEESDSPLDNANFLSFEEWKKQNLAKVDLDQGRNVPLSGRQQPGINNALDSLGEEGEIDIDFSGFGASPSGPSQPRAAYKQPDGASPQDIPDSQTLRSKDAGKTCKERTNYASFDCAAQVLKHNPECKSPYSVLVENKDSYMLNTCSAQNKFFIVELCNQILVDTVVLANYEFFSSIFRHFRVSVSDRYPVKMDKWRDLGTFEARNTREIQAFLIEYPQIWARYLRIEFLTHYGSEYYCPVSLLRVHGTDMLEEFRPQDDIGQIEGSENEAVLEREPEMKPAIPDEPIKPTQDLDKDSTSKTEAPQSVLPHTNATASLETPETSLSETILSSTVASRSPHNQNATAHIPPLPGPEFSEMTCSSNITSATTEASPSLKDTPLNLTRQVNISETAMIPSSQSVSVSKPQDTTSDSSSSTITSSVPADNSSITAATPLQANTTRTESKTEDKSSSPSQVANSTFTSLNSNVSPSSMPTNTNRTVPATSLSSIAQPQPSTQESFFKSLSKRLQQLESNSTLSLQYIEEQSRILRDAFSKVEKRQISSTSNFLTNLNETVMKELHGFRQAYDQLWQSTVLELEGQREQYQREMLALSSRLTLVADELLWQKRMGIVQSTLLLLCLGLVLFARTGQQGYLEVPLMQQMMNKSTAALSRAGWESPPASPSPENRSPVTLFRRKLWRSATEPSAVAGGHGTDGDVTGTDSRPETRDGPNVDVFVEPPTPPPSRGVDRESVEVYDDADADDEEDVLDPRESQSGPSTPTGTRETIERATNMVNGVIHDGVG